MTSIRVLVTGAAGQIAYSLLYSIAKGDVFGSNQTLDLVMLDIKPMMSVLNGVLMELQDCAFPNIKELIATDLEEAAFKDIDVAFLVGSMPRKEGMERKELLKINGKIFQSQGVALDKYAKKNVKILVVGNPANTNAMICAKFAPSIPKENFTAMTRLDQNRATAFVSGKLNILASQVKNVVIWGNHSSTQYPCIDSAEILLGEAYQPAREALKDQSNWIENDFIKLVQQRGAAIISARKLSSAMSAAKAACDHMRDWWFGTKKGVIVSMAVLSDGDHYSIPKGICYSFPVTIDENKHWKIVDGLPITEFSHGKMDLSAKELMEERNDALSFIKD
ncbi:unnamed protein product [Gordionus sp. m RMFG-2023]|uniref:malate dehydrogenase, cytoplasmic-like n=1 Tax=Gordionus sp. m RMFG-2023 TaxID=3053472 RepID=UPI0030DFA898